MDKSCCYYVYVHRRATDYRIFYVGKGKGYRASNRQKRSEYWKKIVSKHGLVVEYVLFNMTDENAKKLEIDLIAFYGRDNLCNMTNGGDGVSGRIMPQWQRDLISMVNSNRSPELKEQIAAHKRGIKLHPDHIEKIRISGIGRKQSQETIEKRASKLRGRTLSKQHRERLSASLKGFKHTKETRENMSKANKGRVITKECRQKISIANSKPVKCSNGMLFKSATYAAKWVFSQGRSKSIGQGNITSCCKGALKTAYGFAWSYATTENAN